MDCLIFGCGFLGSRVAERWMARGDRVAAITRSEARAAEWAARGIRPIVGDVTRAETLRGLPCCDTVLYAVSWSRQSRLSRHQLYVDGLSNVLTALPMPKKFLFISSTGVYGDWRGAWVDENSESRPQRESSTALYDAELLLRSHPLGTRAIVLRMAGMYGPGRMLRLQELSSDVPMPVASYSFLNLIHVDDAAEIVVAVGDNVEPPNLFNVSDGCPANRREYFAYAAELAGLPPPRFVEPSAAECSLRHDGENKRISSRKLFDTIRLDLMYPSYREGLRAVFAERKFEVPTRHS